jgi:uncharacterized protein YjbJ (UPF0337 family)
MNWDVIKGNWKQFKGTVREQWGNLTDDHLDIIAGKREVLSGKIQETYGITKDEAEKQVAAFEERHKDNGQPRRCECSLFRVGMKGPVVENGGSMRLRSYSRSASDPSVEPTRRKLS